MLCIQVAEYLLDHQWVFDARYNLNCTTALLFCAKKQNLGLDFHHFGLAKAVTLKRMSMKQVLLNKAIRITNC
jgi:hypothetical protein